MINRQRPRPMVGGWFGVAVGVDGTRSRLSTMKPVRTPLPSTDDSPFASEREKRDAYNAITWFAWSTNEDDTPCPECGATVVTLVQRERHRDWHEKVRDAIACANLGVGRL